MFLRKQNIFYSKYSFNINNSMFNIIYKFLVNNIDKYYILKLFNIKYSLIAINKILKINLKTNFHQSRKVISR
jgi:hypothetical protein